MCGSTTANLKTVCTESSDDSIEEPEEVWQERWCCIYGSASCIKAMHNIAQLT